MHDVGGESALPGFVRLDGRSYPVPERQYCCLDQRQGWLRQLCHVGLSIVEFDSLTLTNTDGDSSRHEEMAVLKDDT